MQDWINGICDQVDAIAAQNPEYKELSRKHQQIMLQYQTILDTLPEIQRDRLIEYEYITSEMPYLRTQAAYQLGKKHRLRILPR